MNTLLDGKPMDSGQRPPSSPVAPVAKPPSGSSGLLGIISLIVAVVSLLLLAYVAFDLNGAKKSLQKSNEDIASLTKGLDAADRRVLNLGADFSVVKEKLGITQRELDAARAQAEQMQREQQKSAQELKAQLSKKAETTQVSQLKEETSSKIGAVSGEVTNVKTDVEKTKKDLEAARRELLDVRDTLSSQIAHNSSELGDLRRKGERNYVEFELDKKQGFKKVGDLALRLTKLDQKKKKYSLMVSVDDNSLEKKDKTVDEPVQFLVGKDRLRYEIVIYQVGKTAVTGYLSVPKDVKLASENPRPSQ
ncbi:MAG: coiled-coil domain-containing protein [Terriglobia bacterium]|jgi:chromosome segregation ATPase